MDREAIEAKLLTMWRRKQINKRERKAARMWLDLYWAMPSDLQKTFAGLRTRVVHPQAAEWVAVVAGTRRIDHGAAQLARDADKVSSDNKELLELIKIDNFFGYIHAPLLRAVLLEGMSVRQITEAMGGDARLRSHDSRSTAALVTGALRFLADYLMLPPEEKARWADNTVSAHEYPGGSALAAFIRAN